MPSAATSTQTSTSRRRIPPSVQSTHAIGVNAAYYRTRGFAYATALIDDARKGKMSEP